MFNETKPGMVFVPYKKHVHDFFNKVAEMSDQPVFVLCPNVSDTENLFVDEAVPVKLSWFGLKLINKFVKYQMHVPVYLRDLSRILKKTNAKKIIVFDFYHWYTLQCFFYSFLRSDVKIYIYSETKRWPSNLVAKLVMKFFLLLLKINSKRVSKIFVYTNEGASWWRGNAPELKIEVLPASINTLNFCKRNSSRKKSQTQLKILMNARYSPYKHHDDLIDACLLFKEEYQDYLITFVGKPEDGINDVKKLVEDKGLGEKVTFLKPIQKEILSELYQAHDVLVLPSHGEAIGMVVPEAMACGLPTITSDTVGANIYVQHSITGFIFKTGNVDELHSYLKLLYADRELMQSLGNYGFKHIQKCDLIPTTQTFLAMTN